MSVYDLVSLDSESTTADLMAYLRKGRDDHEVKVIVNQINSQGKALFGAAFNLRFDRTIISKNIIKRMFIKLPH